MTVEEAIYKRRTIRKFSQEKIARDKLEKLVDYARVAALGANVQALRYMIIDREDMLEDIFPCTKWAGYLKEGTPKEDERPTAYIAVLGDTRLRGAFECDAGAAVTNMLLGAVGMGIASCWLGALDREKLREVLDVPQEYNICYLVAFGYPEQTSKAVRYSGDFKYYLDENNELCVPKLSLSDVIVEF